MPASLVRHLRLRGHSSFCSTLPRLYCHVPNLSGWNSQPCLSLEMKLENERVWKQHVDSFGYKENDSGPTTYILSMFPYPSGNLHMGHVRVYTISDTLARFYRMLGHNVLHPMGWDAFGLPAENAAMKIGEHPAVWTENNINVMRSQLKQIGCSFDWDREFATCHPNYYKWTQYIFLQMYKAGLIYRKPSLVNWDPIDKTVLADEQIDENGNSWRSGVKVEKRLLTQWFIRSTKFSMILSKELEKFSRDNWDEIINLQKSWIGDVNGILFDWNIEGTGFSLSIPIWTAHPEQLYKVDFIAVKPDSLLGVLQKTKPYSNYYYAASNGKEESFQAALLDFNAINPISQEKIPIYAVDGILPYPDKSDVYMGVPAEVDIDSIFFRTVGLPTKCHTSNAIEDTTAESICTKAQQLGKGGYPASCNLKDWLISRQRYWGTPIPIIHCSACGTVPVPEDQLPVLLPAYPKTKSKTDTIASPLAQAEDWLNTKCPKCGIPATRETDTMDTFVDSSWYYLRFLDPKNEKALVQFEKTKKFMPVNIYVGGKEHGINSSPEPFQRLLIQGMVMGQTLIEKETGRYLKQTEVEFKGKNAFCKETGKAVIIKWDKMSKSKHNGVDPAEAISSFGVDTTRLFMLADAAPFSQRNWDPKGSKGVLNWQNNLYVLISHFISVREDAKAGNLFYNPISPKFIEGEKQAYEFKNRSLSTILHNYKNTHQFMVAIKSMQSFTKKLKLLPSEVLAFGPRFEHALATLILTIAPMAPHFASEMWRGFVSAPGHLNTSPIIDWDKTVLEHSWPSIDDEFELPLVVTVNSKEICYTSVTFKNLKNLNESDLLQIALQQDKVKNLLDMKPFSVTKVSKIIERGARVSLLVAGLKVSEEDIVGSVTKKGRQALAKAKSKKEQSAS